VKNELYYYYKNITDIQMKNITGFEGYTISSNGIIKNKHGKILKKRYNNGYITYCLRQNGKSVYKSAHRLVAKEFIDNPNGYREINHIDGNKTNNHYKNLEWCSRKQNMKHAKDNGLIKIHCSPVLQYTLDGEFIKEWDSAKLASKSYKCHYSTITRVCRGENKTGKGFIWKYKYPPKMFLDDEKCYPITDYEHYSITMSGKVVSQHGKILKPIKNKNNQEYVVLCKNGKKKNMYIKRLISEHSNNNSINS
jgi:hypothetical protein